MTKNLKAFTEIFCGSPAASFPLWSLWGNLSPDRIEIQNHFDGLIIILVANQMINWDYYEETGKFVPASQNLKRSREDTKKMLTLDDLKQEAAKADRGIPIKPSSRTIAEQDEMDFWDRPLEGGEFK